VGGCRVTSGLLAPPKRAEVGGCRVTSGLLPPKEGRSGRITCHLGTSAYLSAKRVDVGQHELEHAVSGDAGTSPNNQGTGGCESGRGEGFSINPQARRSPPTPSGPVELWKTPEPSPRFLDHSRSKSFAAHLMLLHHGDKGLNQ
jgi:hypothetical protein